ncbi:hypothetical protein KHS38_13865 [Mucilaginibacter sp. Bleaf8]|uniref:hypothetical protein n=1 Tax=Mucilaginibacter sp. Bleaf8 TaxID=2834430 RepID=UPI001BCB24A3|nr:hypothetical protein [Mucilaginibacter sp. Bleaf8]MBS7565494.1 hypothetical protein [Mucilaginibacter sp. Bleaf8]
MGDQQVQKAGHGRQQISIKFSLQKQRPSTFPHHGLQRHPSAEDKAESRTGGDAMEHE